MACQNKQCFTSAGNPMGNVVKKSPVLMSFHVNLDKIWNLSSPVKLADVHIGILCSFLT